MENFRNILSTLIKNAEKPDKKETENKPKLEAMSNAASKNSIIDANERIYSIIRKTLGMF